MEIRVMSDAEIEADREKYISLNKDSRFAMDRKYDFICKHEKYANNGGGLEPQYFIQDIWGARKIFERKPSVHYDVGSSLPGFIAHLLSFKQKVVVIDIRPFPDALNSQFLSCENSSGVEYITADATHMSNIPDNSVESLSALCSIEHFGLGRYNDPIDPNAWEKALKSFARVVAAGGGLYLSVPVGRMNKVCFNAHRVYHPDTIIQTLVPEGFEILEFSYIYGLDTVVCLKNIEGKTYINQDNLNQIPDIQNWGLTGLFEFRKL